MAKPQDRSDSHSLIHIEPIEKESLSVSDFFTNKFDYVVTSDMYKPHNNTLAIYDLYRQIMIDKERRIKTPIITLSPDSAISGSTLAGAAEKFMYSHANEKTGNPAFRTNLKVIYIDSSPDLSTRKYVNYSDFMGSVLSDVMGLTENTYNMHRVDIPPENVYLVGIDEKSLDDDQEGNIRRNNIKMFSLQIMMKKGVAKIMKHIINECKYDDVHVVIDLSCMQIRYAPSVHRVGTDGKNGFDFDQMKMIVDSLKSLQRLNGVDITGYNFGLKKDKEKYHMANMLTIKTIEMITGALVQLQQKSINVFNEESRFLIWKRIDDKDLIGWLILRGMSIEEREEMIQMIGDDRIITVPIEDDGETFDAFVTITTMKEQQEKSYYTAESVYDCCLYPGEKLNMMFELLNTPSVQDAQQKTKIKQALEQRNTNDTKLDQVTDVKASEDLVKVVKKQHGKTVRFADQLHTPKEHKTFSQPVQYADNYRLNQVDVSKTEHCADNQELNQVDVLKETNHCTDTQNVNTQTPLTKSQKKNRRRRHREERKKLTELKQNADGPLIKIDMPGPAPDNQSDLHEDVIDITEFVMNHRKCEGCGHVHTVCDIGSDTESLTLHETQPFRESTEIEKNDM